MYLGHSGDSQMIFTLVAVLKITYFALKNKMFPGIENLRFKLSYVIE